MLQWWNQAPYLCWTMMFALTAGLAAACSSCAKLVVLDGTLRCDGDWYLIGEGGGRGGDKPQS